MAASAHRLAVGFMPLLDCAALVAAAECGFASQEGLDLRLVRETSWANIRDRLIVGQFNAAHMLGPMVVASTLGIGHLQVPLVTPVALGLGGNALTVSTDLYEAMRAQGATPGIDPRTQGEALRRVVSARSAAGQPPLILAMVYPFSGHNYLLRYWLSANGIDPDEDVRLVVIPPPLLVDALREHQVDGFCVGEPWSSVAVSAGVGRIVTTSMAIWPNSPEKVLGLRRDWAEADADTVAALVRAVVRAARWCDEPGNWTELARLLAGPRYVGLPASLLEGALGGVLGLHSATGTCEVGRFITFAACEANCPQPHHALWFYRQMVRWRQVADSTSAQVQAVASFRPDLYRAAVGELPSIGTAPTALSPNVLFDGVHIETLREYGA